MEVLFSVVAFAASKSIKETSSGTCSVELTELFANIVSRFWKESIIIKNPKDWILSPKVTCLQALSLNIVQPQVDVDIELHLLPVGKVQLFHLVMLIQEKFIK